VHKPHHHDKVADLGGDDDDDDDDDDNFTRYQRFTYAVDKLSDHSVPLAAKVLPVLAVRNRHDRLEFYAGVAGQVGQQVDYVAFQLACLRRQGRALSKRFRLSDQHHKPIC